MISICVPAYQSIEYLKIFYKGLRKNTKINYELIIHDNGSTDGTLDWIAENEISCSRSDSNLGFCGVNRAIFPSSHDYIMIFNADMYPLPGWDLEIVKQIELFKKENINRFTISSCLIEPMSGNPEYNTFYAGHDDKTFNEPLLLGTYLKEKNRLFKKENTIQWSHPILIPRFMLHEINYLDEDYFPGWNVDNHIPCALYQKGCRNFIMLGSSRVYHFSNKTFNKLPNEIKNRSGQDTFLKKWGFTTQQFRDKMQVATPYRRLSDGVV